MAGTRLKNLGAALRQEAATIRARDPDVDPGELGRFTLPLLLRAVLLVLVGLIPILGTRVADDYTSAVFGPLLASVALAAICTTAVAWCVAILLSGLVVLVLYGETPARASSNVITATSASFTRIATFTSNITLVALIAGLVVLAVGLPARGASDQETSVLDDLLAAQVGCLVAVLSVLFVVETVRASSDIVDSESRIFAWPISLGLTLVSFAVAATAGPFEPTRLVRTLLTEWLPADVDGVPRAQAVADAVPAGARAWSLGGLLVGVVLVWAVTAWRLGGLAQLHRDVLAAGAASTGPAATPAVPPPGPATPPPAPATPPRAPQ